MTCNINIDTKLKFNNQFLTPFLHLIDSLNQSSLPLLIDIVNNHHSRNVPLLLFCIEHSISTWHSWLSTNDHLSSSNLTLIDINSKLPTSSSNIDFWTHHITPAISSFINTHQQLSGPRIIVFDRIDAMDLVLNSTHNLTRHLHTVMKVHHKLSIIVCQSNFMPSVNAIKYLSTTYATIESVAMAQKNLNVISDPDPNDLGITLTSNSGPDLVAHVNSQKPLAGKILLESVLVNLRSGMSSSYTKFPPPTNTTSSMVNEKKLLQDQHLDPTLGLSFNLKLSESQRIAKENVILPYGGGAQHSNTIINYEIDINDEFDDDDPDADLDF